MYVYVFMYMMFHCVSKAYAQQQKKFFMLRILHKIQSGQL